jgi:hypothetical protein
MSSHEELRASAILFLERLGSVGKLKTCLGRRSEGGDACIAKLR